MSSQTGRIVVGGSSAAPSGASQYAANRAPFSNATNTYTSNSSAAAPGRHTHVPGKASISVNASRKAPPAPVSSSTAAASAHHHGSHGSSAAAAAASNARRAAVSSGTTTSGAQHQQQQQSRPQTRLEREKKKDFSDPDDIGPWKLGQLIGTGASGRVRLAHHIKYGTKAAVKIIPRNQIEGKTGASTDAQKRIEKMEIGIEREIIVMKLIKHDNLLSLIDVYETKRVLYLIMEYVEGGELFDHLVACGRLEVDQARNYFRQIMFGVDHCHSFNICHRDLKPENLLLSKDKTEVKVADFGMAALQHSGRMLETSCGSPHYASPEIVSGKAYIGTATDIWSCGIILFALLCGKLPFDDPHMSTLLQKVKEGKFEMPKHLKDEAAKDLISKMLVVDPRKRYMMKEIFQHDWFTNYGRLSSKNPVEITTDDLPIELPYNLEDDDIFRGLTYLFQGVSKEELRRQLTDTAANWPKKFYKLLIKNQWAADNDEEEDDHEPETRAAQPPSSSAARSNSIKAPGSSGRSAIAAAKDEKAKPRRSIDKEQAQQIKASTVSAPKTPSRAPSLNRRSSADAHSSPSTRTPLSGASDASRTRPSVTQRASFDSPRSTPQQALRHRASVESNVAGNRLVPQITLRGATPSADGTPEKASAAVASNVSRAPSPSKATRAASVRGNESSTSVRATSRPNSPDKASRPSSLTVGNGNPAIPVPSVGNAAVQRFFQEMADELASIRASGVPDPRTDKLQAKLDQAVKNGGWLSPISAGGTSPNPQSMDTRFDDAEDDRSEAGSYRSGTDSSSPYTPTSPLPPTLYSEHMAPLAIGEKGRTKNTDVLTISPPRRNSQLSTDSQRGSMLSTRSSTRRSAVAGRPASVFSNATSASNDSERLSVLLGGSRPSSIVRGNDELSSVPYDQTRRGPSPINGDKAATVGRSGMTRLQQRNPGLGLEIHPAGSNVDSPLPSGASINTEVSSPRQASWFGSIFNWKPSVYTLHSVESLTVTLEICRKLLQSFGVVVALENSEHSPTLKCSVIDLKDGTGRSTASKQARFRVEFQVLSVGSNAMSPGLASPNRMSIASPTLSTYSEASTSSRRTGSIKASSIHSAVAAAGLYAVKLKITQEKGSNNTLKSLFHLLREQWTLDQLDAGSPKV